MYVINLIRYTPRINNVYIKRISTLSGADPSDRGDGYRYRYRRATDNGDGCPEWLQNTEIEPNFQNYFGCRRGSRPRPPGHLSELNNDYLMKL